MPENNRRQAYVPVHGRKIENHNGTAPGMIFEDTRAPGKYAVLLPGPPYELKPMFLDTVRPWLAAMTRSALHSEKMCIRDRADAARVGRGARSRRAHRHEERSARGAHAA